MTDKSLLATFRHYEIQVNHFLIEAAPMSGQKNETYPELPFRSPSPSIFMIHRQISVKLREDLYLRLEKTSKVMHLNKHAIVVTAVEDTLDMIDNRGCEKVPLLVVQARTAQDYAQEPPPLTIRSDTAPPEKRRQHPGKSTS